MLIVRSRSNVAIRLTDERWEHIITRHPEMANQTDRVLETVSEPELIQEGDSGALLAIRHYVDTPLTSKYLVVAYRELSEHDGFVLTAYLTNRPSDRRATLWRP